MVRENLRQDQTQCCSRFVRRLHRSKTEFLAVISVVLLAWVPAFSQTNFGRILGTVTDQSGAVIAGVTVVVTDPQRGLSRTQTTDSSGEYLAPSLPPGTYVVRAEARGFQTVERPNVILEVGKDIRVDVTLRAGSESQTITVTEAVPLVDTTSATLGGTISNETLNDLPLNGRNFQNLITLRPGVMVYPGGGAWTQSTDGIRAGATVYYVDGLMNNDYNVGWTVVNAPTPITEAGSILPIDAIQEFNLERNPKAEFGWKPGAAVNVGIKSGTNSLHGSAYAFGRDAAWDARNYFNPVTQAALPLSLQQFGATVGGPIKKDKLFFFAGYEGRRDLIGNTTGLTLPETSPQTPADPANSVPDAEAALTAAGIPLSPVSLKLLSLYPANNSSSPLQNIGFPNTDRSDNGIAKIDYHINSHNTLTGMLFVADYTGVGEDRPYPNAKFLTVIPMKDWVNNYSWIWTPNSRWVNQARFGFNRMTENIVNADSGVPASSYGINTGITSPGGLPSIGIGGFAPLGTTFTRPGFNGPSPLYDGLDTVSYVRGRHAIKFGFEVAHIEADAGGFAFGRGSVTFAGSGAFPGSTALEDFLAGSPSFGLLLVGNPRRQLAQWSYAGFAQDDWRITPKLTLNAGLRYEYFAPPTEAHHLLGNFDPNVGLVQVGKQISSPFHPDRTNFSPRFGIAWDPTGKGRTAIRAGASLIYDHPFLGEFFGQLATQDGAASGIGTIPTGGQGVQPGGGTIATGVNFFPGPSLIWNGQVFPSGTTISCSAASTCGILGVVPNFKTPYIASWTVGVQHSFTSTVGLDVSYVGNHGARLPTITNINQPDPATGQGAYTAKFPFLGFINQLSNIGHSNYNGLQVTLTQHNYHGLSVIAGYTYAHALDLSSLDAFALLPQDSLHPERDYASSDFDIRHRFTLTTTYAIPGKKAPLQLLEGWKINSIATLQSGQPWTVDDTTQNISGTFDLTDRWDFFGNPSDFTSGSNAIPFFAGASNASCVAAASTPALLASLTKFGCYAKGKSVMIPPGAGTFGTMGRNLFRDAGFRNWDVSVFKMWRFGERFSGQFRAEFFNVLNHPNFANPYGGPNGFGTTGAWDPSSPFVFGCGCATPDVAAGNPIVGSGDARAIQLGFKLLF
jgi:outer membrane receptor protein involved in Fe transport